VDFYFELPKDYPIKQGGFAEFDLIQTGAPGKPEQIVGGQRFVFDLTKLTIVKAGDQWRFRDDVEKPGQGWTSPDFKDSKWKLGRADLGFGIASAGREGRKPLFLRHTFDVGDPTFFRSLVLRLKNSDGAVIYLNGKEVHRANLPPGAIAMKSRIR